jgi:hypothetical protein
VVSDDIFYLTHVPTCSSSSVLVQINVRDFYPDPVASDVLGGASGWGYIQRDLSSDSSAEPVDIIYQWVGKLI